MMGLDGRVSLVRCTEYEPDQVQTAIRRSIDLLGGMSAFVKPGQRVVIKPNLLRPSSPSAATTTHPEIVAAVANLVREAGARPFILDSPGGPNSAAYIRTVYRTAGMYRAAEQGGAELITDLDPIQISLPDGLVLHRIDLVRQAVEADAVINVAKLKTHSLAGLTLSVKNLFGLVPGVIKVGYHARFRDPADFALGLLDVARAAKPTLNIVDGVVGMEGNGPSAGTPRGIGAILAGAAPLDVDIVAASLVGVDPTTALTTRVAADRGLTTGHLDDVEVMGDPLADLRIEGFRLPDSLNRGRHADRREHQSPGENGQGTRRSWFTQLGSSWLAKQFLATPQVGPKCTGCGFCAKNCPVQAITIVNKRAQIDLQTCIRCYCCHELCPELAIGLHRTLVGRILAGTR